MSDQPPKFVKPRTVPYSLKRKIEEELYMLVQTKVIEPVRYADWATPIMPVLSKADGNSLYTEGAICTVRIAGNILISDNAPNVFHK